MRPFPVMLSLACLALPSATAVAAPPVEPERGVYRFGGTYDYSFTDTAETCQALCTADEACVAWSFVKSNSAGNSRCELKDAAGTAQRNPFATSGMSAAQAKDLVTRSVPTISDIEETSGEELAGGLLPSPPIQAPHY